MLRYPEVDRSQPPPSDPRRDGREGVPAAADASTADGPRQGADGPSIAPRRPGFVTLFPRSETGAPECWRVARVSLIGRGHEADIRLGDARVSRAHATAEPGAYGLFLRDLESRHGCFVDGERVGSGGAVARTGSLVRVGDTLLSVVDDVDRHRAPARRVVAASIGLPKDLIAGAALADVWDQAARAARLSDPVLILGETGCGKEGVARIIHARAPGRGPFVGVNVAAVPEAMFEAELFGHERGAFTGATAARAGAFREASDGVLFLDEIGDLRSDLQAKLLRAIDLAQVRPLGGGRDVSVTARVVSATSHALDRACAEGRFRKDLLHRLSGLVIRVPPLRERPEDIMLLSSEFLRDREVPFELTADAAEMLLLATWEGNARQLRYTLARAIDRASGIGSTKVRSEDLSDLTGSDDRGDPGSGQLTAKRIRAAMLETGGVASRAAQRLGVSRTTLYNVIKRLKLDRDSLRGA